MVRIVTTTDDKFIGQAIDLDRIMLDGELFVPDKITRLEDGTIRLCNSNYIIEAVEEE